MVTHNVKALAWHVLEDSLVYPHKLDLTNYHLLFYFNKILSLIVKVAKFMHS